MIQTNSGLNSARSMANNGQVFVEDTSAHTGVWCGFMPHKDGCKVSAITLTTPAGATINQTHASISSWIGTTADLDTYMGAGLIGAEKAYITSITLASGACTLQNDTMSK